MKWKYWCLVLLVSKVCNSLPSSRDTKEESEVESDTNEETFEDNEDNYKDEEEPEEGGRIQQLIERDYLFENRLNEVSLKVEQLEKALKELKDERKPNCNGQNALFLPECRRQNSAIPRQPRINLTGTLNGLNGQVNARQPFFNRTSILNGLNGQANARQPSFNPSSALNAFNRQVNG